VLLVLVLISNITASSIRILVNIAWSYSNSVEFECGVCVRASNPDRITLKSTVLLKIRLTDKETMKTYLKIRFRTHLDRIQGFPRKYSKIQLSMQGTLQYFDKLCVVWHKIQHHYTLFKPVFK
jgi:hypothetical protein